MNTSMVSGKLSAVDMAEGAEVEVEKGWWSEHGGSCVLMSSWKQYSEPV